VSGPPYSAAFTHNGDGQRVKQVINPSTGSGPCCETTYFVGSYLEQRGGQITTCYYAGSERIAQRIPRSLSRSLTVQARFPSASPKRDHACNSVHPSASGLA